MSMHHVLCILGVPTRYLLFNAALGGRGTYRTFMIQMDWAEFGFKHFILACFAFHGITVSSPLTLRFFYF